MKFELADDQRAIANRIIIFGLIIIIVALLSATLNQPFNDLANETDKLADTSSAQTGLGYIEAMWDYKEFAGLMLGVSMLIAGALYESERGL